MLFYVHITELFKKIMEILMYINRISDNFDKPTRALIVGSLMLSLMNYCISIWGSTNITLLQNLQKLQNFAAKVATRGLRKYDHVTPVPKDLQWMAVNDKYAFQKCLTMYKAKVNRL